MPYYDCRMRTFTFNIHFSNNAIHSLLKWYKTAGAEPLVVIKGFYTVVTIYYMYILYLKTWSLALIWFSHNLTFWVSVNHQLNAVECIKLVGCICLLWLRRWNALQQNDAQLLLCLIPIVPQRRHSPFNLVAAPYECIWWFFYFPFPVGNVDDLT